MSAIRRFMVRASLAGVGLSLAIAASAAPVALPAYTKSKLKNGLTVIIMPSKRLPLVDMRLVARAGSVQDAKGQEGLASLTADLLTQGAGRRTAQQIAGDIEFVGGTLRSAAGSEQTTVSCEVLKKDLATGLELFRDVIVSPTFAAAEFERKKEEALGALASQKSNPQAVADNMFAEYLWGDTPLGHRPLGREAGVRALSRDDVVAFHRKWITPDRSILAIVGDVDPKTILATIDKAFAGWKPSGAALTDPYTAPGQVRGRTVRIVAKPEATQTQIRMACLSVPRNHPDYYPIMVANTILGSGFTSRLVNTIRVEKGLTYSIRSGFPQYRAAGAFQITTFTRNETLRECMDAVLAEVQKLVAEGPTTAEYDKARNYLMGQYPIDLQAPDDLAAELCNVEFFGLQPKYIETYNDRIRAVSMDDVKRVLKQYFCVDDLRMLVVSPPDVAQKALAGLGELETVKID